jgi:hypothetical protein
MKSRNAGCAYMGFIGRNTEPDERWEANAARVPDLQPAVPVPSRVHVSMCVPLLLHMEQFVLHARASGKDWKPVYFVMCG